MRLEGLGQVLADGVVVPAADVVDHDPGLGAAGRVIENLIGAQDGLER